MGRRFAAPLWIIYRENPRKIPVWEKIRETLQLLGFLRLAVQRKSLQTLPPSLILPLVSRSERLILRVPLKQRSVRLALPWSLPSVGGVHFSLDPAHTDDTREC